MKNIFKEYKKLRMENERLQRRINTLENENIIERNHIEKYYENVYQRKLDFEKAQYNTIIRRKKQAEKLASQLEENIESDLKSLMINKDELEVKVESYLKILNYLKEDK